MADQLKKRRRSARPGARIAGSLPLMTDMVSIFFSGPILAATCNTTTTCVFELQASPSDQIIPSWPNTWCEIWHNTMTIMHAIFSLTFSAHAVQCDPRVFCIWARSRVAIIHILCRGWSDIETLRKPARELCSSHGARRFRDLRHRSTSRHPICKCTCTQQSASLRAC